MAKFAVEYTHQADYNNKVDIDIQLQSRPTQEDYQSILDAIATLDKIAKKYIVILPKEAKENK